MMQQPQDNADGRYLEACAVRATEGRMTTTTTVMTTCLEPREVSLGKEGVFEVGTALWKVDGRLARIRQV